MRCGIGDVRFYNWGGDWDMRWEKKDGFLRKKSLNLPGGLASQKVSAKNIKLNHTLYIIHQSIQPS